MLNVESLTENQNNWFLETTLSGPFDLKECDLDSNFLYSKEYGCFNVLAGCHQDLMCLFMCIEHNVDHWIYLVDKGFKFKYKSDVADYWFENSTGVVFKSSVGKQIYTNSIKNLTRKEKEFFGDNLTEI